MYADDFVVVLLLLLFTLRIVLSGLRVCLLSEVFFVCVGCTILLLCCLSCLTVRLFPPSDKYNHGGVTSMRIHKHTYSSVAFWM